MTMRIKISKLICYLHWCVSLRLTYIYNMCSSQLGTKYKNLQIMFRIYIVTYVILLCCHQASLFSSDFVIFHSILNHNRAHYAQNQFNEKCSQMYHQKKPRLSLDQSKQIGASLQQFQLFSHNQVLQGMLLYSKKFRQLNFSLQLEQLKTLALDVKKLCEKDRLGMFFISAYFIRACQILQKNNTPVFQISRTIRNKINLMMDITSISTYRKQKYGINQMPIQNNFWKLIQQEVQPMSAGVFKLKQNNKDQQVQQIIMKMVQQAKSKFDLFNNIVEKSCKLNGGVSYHVNYKLSSRQQRYQMKRIKQKLFRKYLQMFGEKCSNTLYNLSSKRKMQQTGFDSLLKKIYENLNQVQFVIKDLLRAKCMLNSPQQIRSTALNIIAKIKSLRKAGYNIKLVQFQNRIDKITCDVVLVIQIDSLSYQVQLTLQFDQHLFQISHKMYELARSKVFSPIVLLFNWFQKSAPIFLTKVGHYLMQNQYLPQQCKILHYAQTGQNDNLLKQYQLLNQFFNVTSYHNFGIKNQQQLHNQLEIDFAHKIHKISQPFQASIQLLENYAQTV